MLIFRVSQSYIVNFLQSSSNLVILSICTYVFILLNLMASKPHLLSQTIIKHFCLSCKKPCLMPFCYSPCLQNFTTVPYRYASPPVTFYGQGSMFRCGKNPFLPSGQHGQHPFYLPLLSPLLSLASPSS